MMFPKPVRKEKPKRWGSRRRRRPPNKTAALAFPRPETPARTKHGRRPRERGRMLFYATLWCMLRDMGQGGNIEPHLLTAALACEGEVQVAHLGERGGRGTGGWRRAPDAKSAPLCRKHHDELDGRAGRRARKWFVDMGRVGQQHMKNQLVFFAGAYWNNLAPDQQETWNARALAGGVVVPFPG